MSSRQAIVAGALAGAAGLPGEVAAVSGVGLAVEMGVLVGKVC
jgi:hypothetical protein